jgi:putative FmdB family regulatory protein
MVRASQRPPGGLALAPPQRCVYAVSLGCFRIGPANARERAARVAGRRFRLLYWRSAMPTYQYRCEQCGATFEHAEHFAEHEATHACPKCGSQAVQHVPTPFMAKTSRKS